MTKKRLIILFVSILAIGLTISPLVALAQSDNSDEELDIAVVVKISGIPWFNRLKEGVKQASEDFNVNAFQQGPANADPAPQVKMVEDLIARGVDAICVVPNDAQSLVPAFEKAKEEGIVVLTHESPFFTKAQDYDIETINNTEYGKMAIDQLAKRTEGEVGYVQFVGSLTVPLHNYWADTAVEYAKEEYPRMTELTERLPVAESQEDSYRSALDLIRKHGKDLDAIIGWGSLGPPGAAQAVREKGLTEEIIVGGSSLPSQAASYLADGSMDWLQLWDPKDAGYAMVYMAKQLAQGKEAESGMEIPGLGEITVEDKVISVNQMVFMEEAEEAEEAGF
ncbi:MAG: substrate-binding domain-containing protein [Candidatus Bipolaricaulota bacterium]|nr:substrate-binding domain-containing protein [Candidatus Bipolaricaulota bacterium]